MPSIRKNPLPNYHQTPPPCQNLVQIDEIEWDCSRLVKTVEVQGIQDDKDKILKNVEVVWGILPKGITKLKKMVMEDDVANITRSAKQYKPSFLEKDHLGRDIGERSKPTKPKGKEEKEEKDRVLTRLKKIQAHVSVWGLPMASHKHCSALLDALNGKEVPIETTS